MKQLLKWPLIAAVILLVVRVILEQAGAPATVNNIFGVTWLYFLVPVYFAFAIYEQGANNPYGKLFQVTVLFVLLTRLMIAPTYSLAYALNWSAPRFAVENGGVVGEGVTALQGTILIPLQNVVIGTVFGTVIAMLVGSISLLIRSKTSRTTTA